MRIKLNNGVKLLTETKKLQKEFIKQNTYWSLEECLDALILNDNIITNIEAINYVRPIAQKIDSEVEEIKY